MVNYYEKYIKYKAKYLALVGGGTKTAKNYFYSQIKKNYNPNIFLSDRLLMENFNVIIFPKKNDILCETIEKIKEMDIFIKIFSLIENGVASDNIDVFCRMYMTQNLGIPNSLENKGRFNDNAQKFQVLKNNRKIQEDSKYKSINDFDTLTELENFIDEHKSDLDDIEASKANKGKKKEFQKKIKAVGESDVEIELETPNIIIYIPTTKEGSIYYGRNTRWCTASRENNMYEYYNKLGILHIIQSKENDKDKYQFHFETKSFMDATDTPIKFADFFNVFNNDEQLINWVVEKTEDIDALIDIYSRVKNNSLNEDLKIKTKAKLVEFLQTLEDIDKLFDIYLHIKNNSLDEDLEMKAKPKLVELLQTSEDFNKLFDIYLHIKNDSLDDDIEQKIKTKLLELLQYSKGASKLFDTYFGIKDNLLNEDLLELLYDSKNIAELCNFYSYLKRYHDYHKYKFLTKKIREKLFELFQGSKNITELCNFYSHFTHKRLSVDFEKELYTLIKMKFIEFVEVGNYDNNDDFNITCIYNMLYDKHIFDDNEELEYFEKKLHTTLLEFCKRIKSISELYAFYHNMSENTKKELSTLIKKKLTELVEVGGYDNNYIIYICDILHDKNIFDEELENIIIINADNYAHLKMYYDCAKTNITDVNELEKIKGKIMERCVEFINSSKDISELYKLHSELNTNHNNSKNSDSLSLNLNLNTHIKTKLMELLLNLEHIDYAKIDYLLKIVNSSEIFYNDMEFNNLIISKIQDCNMLYKYFSSLKENKINPETYAEIKIKVIAKLTELIKYSTNIDNDIEYITNIITQTKNMYNNELENLIISKIYKVDAFWKFFVYTKKNNLGTNVFEKIKTRIMEIIQSLEYLDELYKHSLDLVNKLNNKNINTQIKTKFIKLICNIKHINNDDIDIISKIILETYIDVDEQLVNKIISKIQNTDALLTFYSVLKKTNRNNDDVNVRVKIKLLNLIKHSEDIDKRTFDDMMEIMPEIIANDDNLMELIRSKI